MQNQFVRALLPCASIGSSVKAMITATAMLFSCMAFADPVLYAGSIYQINDVATVYGVGFGAGDKAVVRIITPGGESADNTVVADEEGKISVSLVLQDEGKYFAMLMNADGEAEVSISLIAN